MDFYQNLGYLILGSRLRRLSEHYLSEINQVYLSKNIDFDASWFPVFYLLSQHQPISNQELADNMSVSHSAASQLINTLKKRKLVQTVRDKVDGRRLEIGLTEAGENLLKQLLPIWSAIEQTMLEKLCNDVEDIGLLNALTATEKVFQKEPLAQSIFKKIEENDGV